MVNKKGITVWFTGLPSSGKTTIATSLEDTLRNRGIDVERLDGDTFRKTISRDLGFSPEDREKNIERVAYVAEMLTRHHVVVLTAFISPYRAKRNWARELIKEFMEVYVYCPLEICEKRDAKGLYRKAHQGIILEFTGISAPYEEPLNPDVVLQTHIESVAQCTNRLLMELYKRGIMGDEVFYV